MSESMIYNTVGNLTARTGFNGKTTTYGYDALNRLLSRTPDASLGEPAVTYTYTASGQRQTMSDASGLTTYGYDARDRLATKATPQGTLSYGYDAAGHVASIASNHAQGASTSYGYDALNRLGTVNDAHLGATSYAYDAVGNLQSYALPNGTAHAYAYSTVNRLTSMAVWRTPLGGSPSVLASATYTLAAGGQRLGVSETLNPQLSTLNRSVTYTYDGLIRLTQEAITGAPGHSGTVGYTFDPVGNRLTRTSNVSGLSNQSFNYDANDRLTSDTYDANGNTKLGKVSLNATGAEQAAATANDTYDSENRLVALSGSLNSQPSTLNILYDGDGNKVRETRNGQTFSYLIDDRNPTGYAQGIEELQNGTPVRTYTYGHDPLAQDQRDGSGNWSATFYGYDGHGSVRLLTDETGAITDTYTYDAFGTLLASTGTTFNRYRYSGEQFDDALGLYYLRARYLNAANGRFWNADTFEGQNSDPLSLHRYLYAAVDPVNGLDPSGHFTISETMVSTAIRGGLVSMAVMAPLRAYQFAHEISDGHSLAQASTNAALSLAQDFTIGAVTGAVFQWIPGIIRAAKVGEAFTRASNSVWTLGWAARGRAIEQMVMGRLPAIKGIVQQNFPVIDDFWNGIATSIKSVDLRAASYQSVSALKSVLRGYANDLAAFQGAQQGAMIVTRAEIGERLLLVAVEEGAATAQQIQALNQFAIEAGGKGIRLVFQWIP